jgi:hypothetical protein
VLTLSPITLTEAAAFVARVHRHHKPPQGGLFAVACSLRVTAAGDTSAAALECGAAGEERIVGVAIIGRPVSRMLADGYTAEVTRLATDGSRNACSILYAAAWRACRALGYRRLITYILDTEPGTSLVAAGWRCVWEAGGGSWSRTDRPRVDLHPTQGKLRFEVGAERGQG